MFRSACLPPLRTALTPWDTTRPLQQPRARRLPRAGRHRPPRDQRRRHPRRGRLPGAHVAHDRRRRRPAGPAHRRGAALRRAAGRRRLRGRGAAPLQVAQQHLAARPPLQGDGPLELCQHRPGPRGPDAGPLHAGAGHEQGGDAGLLRGGAEGDSRRQDPRVLAAVGVSVLLLRLRSAPPPVLLSSSPLAGPLSSNLMLL
ncbi:hypothetical protein VTK73DRAFT_831 [Phialemonium thermophilum]|uniref:Uncharacterized protein n=1 Tax=Phialemonium thermophilum TaxID=223376 RepID=A0ABR3VUD9_9PEZI